MRRFSLFMIVCTFLSCTTPEVERPNILFIAIDDLNDWVGPLNGHPQVQTPYMDQLSEMGTTFLNAHCQAPLCNPSRTSLMTGLRPSTTGVYALQPWFRDVDQLRNIVTLPQYFEQNGYTTYSTGKIYHGGFGYRERDSLEWSITGPRQKLKAKPDQKLVNTPHPSIYVDWGVFPHRDEDKGDWEVASWAVDQMKNGLNEPFFLAVGFFLPHVPLYTTQKWQDLYPENKLQLPPVNTDDREDTPRFSWYMHWKLAEPRLKFLQDNNQHYNLVQSYLASISFMDSQIGRLLESLKQNNLEENTIIVLWSDHGWHLGEKLITGKNSLWDRSTRVPLIFAGPGINPDTQTNKPVELLDIYPTLIDLCGLPFVNRLEGHSLLPQLQNPDEPRDWPAITTHGPGNHGIRTEKWRYIQYADGSEELYDMEKDPNEWVNLAGTNNYSVVKNELSKWVPVKNVPPVPESHTRLIELKENGEIYWENEPVGVTDPIPEL